eukprot:4266242-Amphidinium_carterae.1
MSDGILPSRLQGYLEHPNRLLKPESELQGPRPRMYFDVKDWETLASELWERGMIRWIPSAAVPLVRESMKRAGLFGVPKSSGSKLRMIVDRRPANWAEYNLRELLLQDLEHEKISLEEFEQLWRLMCLPFAGALQDIFLGMEGELQVTTEDCSDYFYMLLMPHHLHPHTAIGWCLYGDQIKEHQLACDLSLAEIAGAPSFAAVLRVVPMGDRKAMEIAQAVHQYVHLKANTLAAQCQMTHGWALPGQPALWGSYCDDLALIDLVHHGLGGQCAAHRVLAESADRLERVKARYAEVHLRLKLEKEKINMKEATVWGACLSSARREIRGDLVKMKALVFLTARTLKAHRISTHAIQKLVGFWVHHCLFQRAALCVLQETYRWLEEGAQQPHALRVLPGYVRQELQGFIVLYPLIRSDLSSCISPEIYATDATMEIGAVTKAQCSPEDAVLAWSRRSKHLSHGVAILEAQQLYRLEREERRDSIWEELIAKLHFRLVTKYRFRTDAHINVKELLAARTALRHAVRSRVLWHTRVIIAVDSQVAVWCMKRGRSSSRALNQILQTMLGDVVCTGVRMVPVWVATEVNPADAPTRRRRIPPPQVPPTHFWEYRKSVLESHPWTLALNKHEWAQRFDSTLGYPGEGPAGPRERVILGPVKTEGARKDLRVSIQPATVRRYRGKYELWQSWLAEEDLPEPDEVINSPALDAIMSTYLQRLYNDERPLSYGLETLAALQFFHPRT